MLGKWAWVGQGGGGCSHSLNLLAWLMLRNCWVRPVVFSATANAIWSLLLPNWQRDTKKGWKQWKNETPLDIGSSCKCNTAQSHGHFPKSFRVYLKFEPSQRFHQNSKLALYSGKITRSEQNPVKNRIIVMEYPHFQYEMHLQRYMFHCYVSLKEWNKQQYFSFFHALVAYLDSQNPLGVMKGGFRAISYMHGNLRRRSAWAASAGSPNLASDFVPHHLLCFDVVKPRGNGGNTWEYTFKPALDGAMSLVHESENISDWTKMKPLQALFF